MKFQITKNFESGLTEEEIFFQLKSDLNRISDEVSGEDHILEVKGINTTFGSILRNDKTKVEIKKNDRNMMVIANVEYKPSIMFWVFVIIDLTLATTFLGLLLTIGVYLYHKKIVKDELENALEVFVSKTIFLNRI